MQEGEPLYLADPKYIYEQTVIATNKIGNKDYRIFRYNSKIGSVEYYDIVACNFNYNFGKLIKSIIGTSFVFFQNLIIFRQQCTKPYYDKSYST